MKKDSTEHNQRNFLQKIIKDFVMGCIAFIPLGLFVFVTYYIFKLIYNLLRLLFGITESRTTSVIIGIIVILILIYAGRKIRRRERWLLDFIETVISKIPVIGGWYPTVRDLILNFTSDKDRNYMGTAQIPFGTGYIIGFVTKKEIDADGNTNVAIFVPTSPNPTTGLVFFFPEKDITYIDLTPEKAFTKIISLGTK